MLDLAIGAREGDFVPAARQTVIRINGPDRWQTDDAIEFDDDGMTRTLRFQRGELAR
jgi:hypothetical protein